MSQQPNSPSTNVIVNACGMKNSEVANNSVSTQTEAPDFPCDQCGKICITLGHYRNHAEIHEESQNHSHPPGETLNNLASGICLCETCGKDFSSCEDLEDHMEKVHSYDSLDSDDPSHL